MTGNAKKLLYFLEALPLLCAWRLSSVLGARAGSFVGGRLLRAAGFLSRRHGVARRNLRAVFPEKSRVEVNRILSAMWENLGRTVMEYPHLGSLTFDDGFAGGGLGVETRIAAASVRLFAEGRQMVFIGAHMANWELGPACGDRLSKAPVTFVYRAPNNPWVGKRLSLLRRPAARRYTSRHEGGLLHLARLMRRGECVGILSDQKNREGVVVPLLGLPAPTLALPARLAIQFRIPLVLAHVERLRGVAFRLVVEPPLYPEEGGDRAAEVLRLTARMNEVMGGWIRACPEQWLWIHRRWPSLDD